MKEVLQQAQDKLATNVYYLPAGRQGSNEVDNIIIYEIL